MAYNANLLRFDCSNDEKTFFINGVIRIIKQDCGLVEKDLLCRFER